jgi:hypothetical protein
MMAETAFELAVRQGIERDIVDSNNKHDGDQVNAKLEIYPYGKERPMMGVVACWQALKRKGSSAARFLEKQAIAEATQPTEEIAIVTPEMIEDAAA